MLRAHLRTETAEAAYDFIGNQQNVVLLEHLLDRVSVAFRRRGDVTRAHHRFGDRVRAFLRNELLEFFNAIRGELRFAHAGRRLA